MNAHSLLIRFRYALHHSRLMQIATLVGFWLAGEFFVRLVGLPLPGGIVGMALVLALLLSGRISLFSMKRGAEWFLAEMLLFFRSCGSCGPRASGIDRPARPQDHGRDFAGHIDGDERHRIDGGPLLPVEPALCR